MTWRPDLLRSSRRQHRSVPLEDGAAGEMVQAKTLEGVPVPPLELEEIANLFCDEVLTSVKRSIDVLKPERQRLVLPKHWA